MSTNISQESIQIEKPALKVKIGKDIYIYRTLYLITNEKIFKDRAKKSINFYLKCQIKEKSLIFLPKPQESDIIIEDIKELIELTLSLCILTNSANYKISIFTSTFGNIENNIQLLKYQGNIIYAKLNEFKREDNEEKKNSKILDYNEQLKKNKIKKINIMKTNSVKEYPSIMLKQLFPYKTFGIKILNNKEKENNTIDYENLSNKEKNDKNNEEINIRNSNKRSNSNCNIIPKLPNLISINHNINNNTYGYDDSSYREKIINSHSFNFRDSIQQNKNLSFYNNNIDQENNKLNYLSKTKPFINKMDQNYIFTHKQMCMSKSDFNSNLLSGNSFPINNKRYLSRTLHRNNSFQMNENNILNYIYNKNGTDNNELNPTYINRNNYNIIDTNYNEFKSRNKIKYKTKNFTPFRFSYFSKSNSAFNNNTNNTDYKKIKTLFSKKSEDTLLKDIERQNKEMLIQQQNVKLIKNFLFKPSIITLTKNNFYNVKENRFNSVKNIYIEFKNELKKISYKLNNYIADKEIDIYISDLDTNFKLMGINLPYCLKEYCLYAYFDKYLKEKYPSIIDNILYDPDVTATQLSEVLNSLLLCIHKLKNEERFNLVDYVRSLKSIKNCKLSSDFFEIFVLCPNYFELTKREITKKITLILEIDCITNNVTIENFINYYFIFKFGHLVKLDKKLLFINKLLHMIEGKGGPLQEKIFSDIQYLFKIDNRTKQMLLGRPYEIKLNFHMTLKINQIFNSIVNYFEEKNIKKDKMNNTYNNTSFFSSFS